MVVKIVLSYFMLTVTLDINQTSYEEHEGKVQYVAHSVVWCNTSLYIQQFSAASVHTVDVETAAVKWSVLHRVEEQVEHTLGYSRGPASLLSTAAILKLCVVHWGHRPANQKKVKSHVFQAVQEAHRGTLIRDLNMCGLLKGACTCAPQHRECLFPLSSVWLLARYIQPDSTCPPLNFNMNNKIS